MNDNYALWCNHARVHSPHEAHDWSPQPSMNPVFCPGYSDSPTTPVCPRCHGSTMDPELSDTDAVRGGDLSAPEPPVLVPCLLCYLEPGDWKKKPGVIRAMYWSGRKEDVPAARRFLGDGLKSIRGVESITLILQTLHGSAPAAPGRILAKSKRDCWPVEAGHFIDNYDVGDGVETEGV